MTKYILNILFMFSAVIILTFNSNNLLAQDSLKILTYNIEGMKPGSEPEIRIKEIIKKLININPDIIGIQEINETLTNTSTNQAKIIADSLSSHFGIKYNYFYSFTHLSWDNQFKEFVGIITKYPVLNSGYKSLPQGTFPRKVVWNYIETPIGKINFFSTHLSFSTELARNQQADVIIPYIAEQESNFEGVASILVGDFNSTPTESPILKFTNNGSNSFYYDSYFKIHPYGNPGYTVEPNSLSRRIDYIFIKNNSKLDVKNSYVTMNETYSPGKYCSDHLGVISIFKASPVNVAEIENNKFEFNLSQSYPNPFNPSTTINYSIPSSSEFNSVKPTTLKIYDLLGREVATLVNKEQSAGNYSVKFNASNLTSGVYFYKLQSGNFSQTEKMILMK